MFWKKKTSDNEFVEYESKSRRQAFRLDPTNCEPVYANFGEFNVKIINISAGGVSFECHECSIGDVKPFTVELRGRNIVTINTTAEILARSDNCIFHCKFLNIDHMDAEHIHQYVLFKQIDMRRKHKKDKKKPLPDHG